MMTLRAILELLLHYCSFLFLRDKNLAVFGAWGGSRYCDNPKYLMLYFLEKTNIKCVWVGNVTLYSEMPIHSNFRFVKKGSLLAVCILLRAKYWFFCHSLGDLINWNISGGATKVNLWHGIPLKWMGVRTPYAGQKSDSPKSFLKRCRHIIYQRLCPPSNWWTISSSTTMSKIMVESFPECYTHQRIVERGTPRNDFLIRNVSNLELIAKLRKKYENLLGIPPNKRIVMYMPTWRMQNNNVFTFCGLDVKCRQQLLDVLKKNNAILIEKHHHETFRKQDIKMLREDNILVIPPTLQNVIDPQEFYLITDILISDYSSATLDYALLKRPCIHFIYDYEEYICHDSGLAYDLLSVATGPCVKSVDELIKVIDNSLIDGWKRPSTQYEDLLAFEHGYSADAIFEKIVYGGK